MLQEEAIRAVDINIAEAMNLVLLRGVTIVAVKLTLSVRSKQMSWGYMI